MDENKNHKKQMVAPIIATIAIVIYYILYFCILITVVPGAGKIVLGIIPLIFMGLMVMVCIERINEIKRGETDDLSKY